MRLDCKMKTTLYRHLPAFEPGYCTVWRLVFCFPEDVNQSIIICLMFLKYYINSQHFDKQSSSIRFDFENQNSYSQQSKSCNKSVATKWSEFRCSVLKFSPLYSQWHHAHVQLDLTCPSNSLTSIDHALYGLNSIIIIIRLTIVIVF